MQFTGESINELTDFAIRLVDLHMPAERVCRDPHCRWYSPTMEHYVSDHAQMDEIFREEQRHLGR